MLKGEATNTIIIIFSLIRPRLENHNLPHRRQTY